MSDRCGRSGTLAELRPPVAVALALAMATWACRSEEIVSVTPVDAPGSAAQTVETFVDASEVPVWVDSVFGGFAGPGNSGGLRLQGGSPDLTSRGLVRFESFADSVVLPDATSSILRYDSGRVVMTIDTTRTSLLAAGTTVRLQALGQQWDHRSATWQLAVDTLGTTVPWGVPGGVLAPAILGESVVDTDSDSLVFPLGAQTDSLIRSWSDTMQANTGLALLVVDSGVIVGDVPRIRYRVVPELQSDTAVDITGAATAATFIFDPPTPPVPDGVLRIGGIEGWRVYLSLQLPDSLTVADLTGPVGLRGSTINLAELLLISRSPDPPFRAEADIAALAVGLRDDLTMFGPKTPIGATISGGDFTIQPDSLETADTVRVNLTSVVDSLFGLPASTALPPIRVALRAVPEAGTFGYWEFGAAGAGPTFAPILRLVFTPDTEFSVP